MKFNGSHFTIPRSTLSTQHSALKSLFLAFLAMYSCQNPPQYFDVLIQNGAIIDGTGSATFTADIGIRADTIAFIGKAKNWEAKQVIDAQGYTVAPGFIDPHTHALSDLSDSIKRANLNYLLQGVTTVVVGSDGRSVLNIGDRLEQWEEKGIGTNAALMAGHLTIRKRVMGMRPDKPSEEELANMKTLVTRAMDQGALGLSTGLYYAPASFATTAEVIALARIAAAKGGMYDAHIRDESTYNIGLLAAIEENIHICREAKLPVNISHIKCLGVDVWGKSQAVINLIEQARAEGLPITADQYPYRASGTHLSNALLPRWVFENLDDMAHKLQDPVLLPEIKAGVAENMRRRGGASSLLIVFTSDKRLEGLNLQEIAEQWQMPPVETALEIIKNGSAAIASFNMNDADIQKFMQQDWVMTCSDGTNGHPRKYGTYPKKLREYVFEKKVLSLEEMVYKSTSFPAKVYGIARRGQITTGYFADLILFKPREVIDRATFKEPAQYAEGIHWMLVNGQLTLEEGEWTGAYAGSAIRR